MAASAVEIPHAPTPLRAAVRTEHLTKVYGRGEATVHALDRVTLEIFAGQYTACLLYTSPSPRDRQKSRMPSSA